MEDNATLLFLTNPMYLSILKRKKTHNEEDNLIDTKFYKKRIISLFKTILKGDENPPTNEIKEFHNMFVKSSVKYFERMDKKDIIQEQHLVNNTEDNNKLPECILNDINTIDEANDIMMKKIINIPNLNNYVISKRDNSGNDLHLIPRVIDIDLKQPEFKTKGVKQKKQKNTKDS